MRTVTVIEAPTSAGALRARSGGRSSRAARGRPGRAAGGGRCGGAPRRAGEPVSVAAGPRQPAGGERRRGHRPRQPGRCAGPISSGRGHDSGPRRRLHGRCRHCGRPSGASRSGSVSSTSIGTPISTCPTARSTAPWTGWGWRTCSTSTAPSMDSPRSPVRRPMLSAGADQLPRARAADGLRGRGDRRAWLPVVDVRRAASDPVPQRANRARSACRL